MDSYVYQMILGRFMEAELGVVLQHKLQTAEADAPYKPDSFTISLRKRERMQEAIKDMFEPWGAVAAVREVEYVCRHVPNSSLSLGRFAFTLIPPMLMSLLLVDIQNSDRSDGMTYWASVVCVATSVAIALFTMANKKYSLINVGTDHNKIILEQLRATPSQMKIPSMAVLQFQKDAKVLSAKGINDTIPAHDNDVTMNPLSCL